MNHYEEDDLSQAEALALMDKKPLKTWAAPQKRTFTPQKTIIAPQPKRYEDMNIMELEEELEKENSILNHQYEMHKTMPDMGFTEQVQKTSYKISLIKTHMVKIKPSLKKELQPSNINPTAKAEKMKNQKEHIQSLTSAILDRNSKIEDLKQKNEALLSRCEHLEQFKNTVISEFGIDKYLELLNKVNAE